jgi:hypothetical protein
VTYDHLTAAGIAVIGDMHREYRGEWKSIGVGIAVRVGWRDPSAGSGSCNEGF